MKIHILAVLSTNYTYIIETPKGGIIVDPGEFLPLDAFLKQHNIVPIATLLTHKHWDHVGGVSELIAAYPQPIYGYIGEAFEFEYEGVEDGGSLKIGGYDIQCIHLPGHTMGACAFLVNGCVFTGDVLFGGGSGRLFEGTALDMLGSMDRLAALPDATLVYFGHEYTQGNLMFAEYIEPNNKEIAKRIASLNKVTVPSTILLEKMTNPFLRIDEPAIIKRVDTYLGRQCETRSERLGALREWKNHFDSEGV